MLEARKLGKPKREQVVLPKAAWARDDRIVVTGLDQAYPHLSYCKAGYASETGMGEEMFPVRRPVRMLDVGRVSICQKESQTTPIWRNDS